MNKLEDINIDELRSGVNDDETSIPLTLPVVALRDIIIFPHMVFPLLAGRLATQKAIEESLLKDRMVMLLAQKKPADEEPTPEELYETGVVGRVLQILRLPTGLTKILLEGITRAKISIYGWPPPIPVIYFFLKSFFCVRYLIRVNTLNSIKYIIHNIIQ